MVQMEALLSLGGMEKPGAADASVRLGVWKPRVVGVMGMPFEEAVEVEGCMGVEVWAFAGIGKAPSAPMELGTEPGERA